MTLERAIAGLFIIICLAYGQTAFVTMEAELLPFEKNMSFLPNTLPKWLSVLGVITGFFVLIRPGSGLRTMDSDEIDARTLHQYQLAPAILLLVLMIAYALLLRPIGFLASTFLFLLAGAVILGERRFLLLVSVSAFASVSIWYLVQEVLGIFLRPLPWFF